MLMDHATATSEINQLLGDSSDDDDEVNVPLDGNQELSAGEVDELPEGHNSNKDELHDLLGDSDDDGDGPTITRDSYDSTSGKILIDEQPLIATIRSVNDLDDILGARDADEVTKSPTKDTKDRSMSKMVLPYTYKSKAGDSSIFVRTPNFIKIQSAEYSRLSYNPDQERQFFDGATAVIRWRLKRDADGEVVCDTDGIPVKESNARMVEWSDGSMQLVVGDAVFQCKGLSLDNCYSYAQQKASILSSSSEADQTPAAVSDCLECVGTISQRYMLQPTSLDSEIHARMSMKISERSKKDRRTRDRDYEDITEKPEITLAALARKEEEEMRRERRAKEVSEYRSGGASQLYGRRPSMSAEYLAGRDDDEFDGDNLVALKRTDYEKKPKPSSAQKRRYYEEEEVEDDEEEEEMIGDGFEEEDEVTGSGRSWEQSSSKKAKSRDDASTVLASIEKASKVKKPLKGSDEAVLNSTVDKGSDDDNDLMVQRKRLSRAIIDSDDDEV